MTTHPLKDKMTWTVHPGQGLGPLQFGMSRTACADKPGPGRGMKTFTGSWREVREASLPIKTFADDQLVEIEVLPKVQDVRFEGIDVFASDPVAILREFYRANKGASAGIGSALFLGLGINTTGFIDLKTVRFQNDPDERSITVFKRVNSTDFGTISAISECRFDLHLHTRIV